MRASGARDLLISCADYHCSHSRRLSAEQWADEVRLSDLEPLFVCKACGKRGADVRPDFSDAGQSAPAHPRDKLHWCKKRGCGQVAFGNLHSLVCRLYLISDNFKMRSHLSITDIGA